jgi:DNA polymerase-1
MSAVEKLPIVLIDGMNLAYRSHFAFQGLTTSTKQPTGVLYGFLRTTLKLLQCSRQVVVCWDTHQPCWRRRVYPEYKQTRYKNPVDLQAIHRQCEELDSALGHLKLPSIRIEGLEADDLMGILGRRFDTPVRLYSSDRDLYQLLSNTVQVLKPVPGGWKLYGTSNLQKEFGLMPSQWPQYLALGGDCSDNIRPLPGCGPKTAQKMVFAGADLLLPFRHQLRDFRCTFAKYESHWAKAQKALKVTLLPFSFQDPRVKEAFHNTSACIPHQRAIALAADRLEFNRFCAKFELLEFLSRRREFFQC